MATDVQETLARILEGRPALRRIAEAPTLREHLDSGLAWNPPTGVFPHRDALADVIVGEITRLHGGCAGQRTRDALAASWVVETGAHLNLPRRFDRAAVKDGPQANPLVFQGQTLWVAATVSRGLPAAISLSSGRVPVNNANSGCYLDYAPQAEPIRLASNRYKETPQSLVPALPESKWNEVRRRANGSAVAEAILAAMTKPAVRFADQIVRGHAAFMSLVLPAEVRHVTVDSERVGAEFLRELFHDETSLLFRVFSDAERTNRFIAEFADLDTGWKESQTPFNRLEPDRDPPKFAEYDGALDPACAREGLASGDLFAKGPLKFFAFMVEGGLCPIGGMFQSGYCTRIRDLAARLLRDMGHEARAQTLATMPTEIAVVTPVWGVSEANDTLANALDLVERPLTRADLKEIGGVSGRSALALATPTLAQLLLGERMDISHTTLARSLGDALVI